MQPGLEILVCFRLSSQKKGSLTGACTLRWAPWPPPPLLPVGFRARSFFLHLLQPILSVHLGFHFLRASQEDEEFRFRLMHKNTNPLVPLSCLRLPLILLIDETLIFPETQAPLWPCLCPSWGGLGVGHKPTATGSLRRNAFPDVPEEASSSHSRPFCAFLFSFSFPVLVLGCLLFS